MIIRWTDFMRFQISWSCDFRKELSHYLLNGFIMFYLSCLSHFHSVLLPLNSEKKSFIKYHILSEILKLYILSHPLRSFKYHIDACQGIVQFSSVGFSFDQQQLKIVSWVFFTKKVLCKLVLRSSQTVTQWLFYLESKFVNLGFCGVNVRKVKS